MAKYEFYDKDEAKAKILAMPAENILRQHRQRCVMHTERCGTIVMRYLPQRVKKNIDMIRMFRYPKYPEIEEELMIIAPLVETGNADEETTARYAGLLAELKPSLDLYMTGIIEYPIISDMDEIDSLLEALTEEERGVLMGAAVILSSACPPAVDAEYLMIADRFRIPIADKDMIDSMTRQQHELLTQIMKNEEEMIRKMRGTA